MSTDYGDHSDLFVLPAQRDRDVVRMWREGRTARDIMQATGVRNRNVVAGIISRARRQVRIDARPQDYRFLSKAQRSEMSVEQKAKKLSTEPTGPCLLDTEPVSEENGTTEFVTLRMPPPKPKPAVYGVPTSIVDLREQHCRWPLDQRDSYNLTMYCGCLKRAGSAYCDEHHSMSYVGAQRI